VARIGKELVDLSAESSINSSPECPESSIVPTDFTSETVPSTGSSLAASIANEEDAPRNSTSLTRWERKVQEFEEQQTAKKFRVTPPCFLSGPSPVSSRTRTSLKRSSSLSYEDEVRVNSFHEDRMSVSLRKALNKRKSREAPQVKRGKRDIEGCS
jgi:hypothetical protein